MNIRKNTKVAAVLVIAFWIVVISILVGVESMIHKERKLSSLVKPQIVKQQNIKDELIKRREELDRLRHTVKVLEEERVPPVSGWFLGHLCNELPDGLILTKTRVLHKVDKWEVLIEGVSTKESGVTAEKLKLFSGNLQNGPFKMHVSRDWNADWLKQLREGNRGNYMAKKFSIVGVIR